MFFGGKIDFHTVNLISHMYLVLWLGTIDFIKPVISIKSFA